MPKYYQDKICGYYLYFTSFCVIECMHVHASDRKLTEEGSAKFFVKADGDTVYRIEECLMIEIFEKYKHTLNGTIRRCIKNGLNIVRMTSIMETNWLVM